MLMLPGDWPKWGYSSQGWYGGRWPQVDPHDFVMTLETQWSNTKCFTTDVEVLLYLWG